MQNVNQLHERAIQLWIHFKKLDENKNPAANIFFALTDKLWPGDIPIAQNVIELCNVLNTASGYKPLTLEERHHLNALAVHLFTQQETGASPFQIVKYLVWVDRIGYVLGLVTLVVAGFSWWIMVLMVAVWLFHKSALTAARMAAHEPRPSWEAPVLGFMHVGALCALIGLSVARLIGG